MQVDPVPLCALHGRVSYETGGRVGVDGTRWTDRARVLDPPILVTYEYTPLPPLRKAAGPHAHRSVVRNVDEFSINGMVGSLSPL